MPAYFSSRLRDPKAFVAVASVMAALTATPPPAVAASAGPFRPFLGSWRGAGEILSSNGQQEPIRCRADYNNGGDEQTLTQTLVCASDSFRLNIECSVQADGAALQGQWRETTRGVQGDLAGQVSRGDFEGQVSGGGFTAEISIRVRGRRQIVHIAPSAGDVKSVDITLNKGG